LGGARQTRRSRERNGTARRARSRRSPAAALFTALALIAVHAVIAPAHAVDGEALPAEIARVITALGVPMANVSIVVQALGADTAALSHSPDVQRNPASVMKTVTTWAALETLGPAYTWRTEVYFDGPFDGNRLDGDLVLKGYGDPFLVEEHYWKMLRSLRTTGLSEITGDFVVDATHFDVVEDDPGAFDNEPYRTYNVVPNALLVNFKAVQFRVLVDAANGRVRVVPEPALSNLEVDNRLRLGDGACGGFQRGVSFEHADSTALDDVVLSGTYSRRCNAYSLGRTALQHDTYAFGLFETLWREIGGKFSGELRSAPAPESAQRALTWRSPPLGEIIRNINKNSNNVMTRQLLYTLGAERFGPPGTTAKGIEAVNELLTARGIDPKPLVLHNGAGLSRNERVSARFLVDLLLAAARSPYAAEFIASLSLGGMDGTTRGRFGGGPADGVMHVKTGRIDHVSALAGYVHGQGGGTYVVAIFVNNPEAHRGPGQEIEEAVMRWVQARL
jgi:D-alanyl-D-alanine carboxypeptidase/D-alanyl-D-alanine-endopeptidase (penicillin-binding protein 4)